MSGCLIYDFFMEYFVLIHFFFKFKSYSYDSVSPLTDCSMLLIKIHTAHEPEGHDPLLKT